MNHSRIVLCGVVGAVALSLALAGPASAAVTQTVQVDFNADASTYTNNFKRWALDPDNPQGFTWGAAVGTGGTGGLEVTNTGGNNIFYRPSAGNGQPGDDATSTFDIAGLAAGAAFSSSIDFVWSDIESTGLTVITFGLATTRIQNAMSSSGSIGGSIIRNGSDTVTLRLRSDNTTVSPLAFDQSTLTAGDWYRLAFDLTKTATENMFDYTVSLFSIGADGTSTPTLFNDGTNDITISGTQSNASIYGDADAFFGYDIRDTSTSTGISHVDNFVIAVPEPASLGLLVLGGLAMLKPRRRG